LNDGHEPIGGDAQSLSDGLEQGAIGLMWQDPADVFGAQSGLLQGLVGGHRQAVQRQGLDLRVGPSEVDDGPFASQSRVMERHTATAAAVIGHPTAQDAVIAP